MGRLGLNHSPGNYAGEGKTDSRGVWSIFVVLANSWFYNKTKSKERLKIEKNVAI